MSILGIGKLLCTLLVLYWGWFAASGFVDASSSTIAWATSVGVGFFCLRLLAEVGLTILGLLTIARNAGRKLVRGATGEWWAYARNYRKRQREESSSEPNEVGAAEEA